MTALDEEKVLRLLSTIKQTIEKSKVSDSLSKEEFLANYEKKDTAKYNLVIGIEAMINIGNHFISRFELGVPEDYTDVFKVLNKLNIFSDEEISKLVQMARYRNKLVHLYWKVDDSEVYENLKDNIETFIKFETAIQKYLRAIKIEG